MSQSLAVPLPEVDFEEAVKLFETGDLKTLSNNLLLLATSALDCRINEGDSLLRIWRPFAGALVIYGMYACQEIKERVGKIPSTMNELVALQYVVGQSTSLWECPSWMVSDQYIKASKSFLVERDPEHYSKVFPEVTEKYELPEGWMEERGFKPYIGSLEHEGPFCECQGGSVVYRKRTTTTDWWICGRCDRTIQAWYRTLISFKDPTHSFKNGPLEGQGLSSSELPDNEEWSHYRITDETEVDMFGIEDKFIWELAEVQA